jgi:PAS domain S-box-containing protein
MIAVKKRPVSEPVVNEDVVEEQQLVHPVATESAYHQEEQSYEMYEEDKDVLVDEEIMLDPKKYILSKTDTKGVIEYGNDYFVEIAGYHEDELIGQPHNIIRHPDMPKIVFKLLWARIKNRQNITAVVKNKSKDGRYYWVVTDFEIKVDKVTNETIGYFAYRTAAPRKAVEVMAPLYQKLVSIEKNSGIEGSEKYLYALLEAEGKSYDQFIDEVTGKNSTMMKLLFAAMKRFFK